MTRYGIILVVLLVLGAQPNVARADLFGQAQNNTPLLTGQIDHSGISLRGGLGLQTYLPTTVQPLLQTQATIGGTCGAFDFAQSLQDTVDAVPQLFEQVVQGLLSQMPMLVLCYASPSLCDLAKHFQALVNAVLQARYAQCQQLQTAMAAAGLKLRGGEASRCLEEAQQGGVSLSTAVSQCLGQLSTIRTPLGIRAGQTELIRDTLQAAGADATTIALAQNLLGEVALSMGSSGLAARQHAPSEGVHQRYETVRATVTQDLDTAATAIAAGQSVSLATVQALALPGQPLPHAALESLAMLQRDPVRYASFRSKLAAGLALTRLTWDIHELQSQLDSAAGVNPHLTDAERATMTQRLARLERELQRLTAEKEVAERHVLPVLDALLDERARLQAEAAHIGFSAPPAPTTPPPLPLPGQLSAGYGY